jgi:hypothetical protein
MSITTSLVLKAIPSAADGVSITPSGTAWNNSSWVELSASTPGIWYLRNVTLFEATNTADDLHFEADIGVGSAGSEAVVGTLAGAKEQNWTQGSFYVEFGIPIQIAAGVRVAIRLRKQGTSTLAWTASLGYYEGSIGSDQVTTLPQQCYPSAADPVSIVSSTSWTFGSWTEVAPALAAGVRIVGVSVYRPTMVSNEDLVLEIGIGGAGSETVLTRIVSGPKDRVFGETLFCVPHRLDATSRISARLATQNAGTLTAKVKLIYYGPQVAAAPSAEGLNHQVIEYTGNGVVGRLILTDFPLDVGAVAVWIYPVLPAGAGTATPPVVRTSADATNSWLDGTAGTSANFITSLTADGFTLGAGDAFGKVNTSGTKYIAIVCSDISATNDLIRVGTYTGTGGDDRLIEVAGGYAWQPTHVWVQGISQVYRSSEFVGDSSVTLRNSVAGANMIQSFAATGFVVGTSVNVNTNTNAYGYVAFKANAAFLATGFGSFTLQGTAVDDVVSGLGFTPGFLLAKEYSASGVSYYKSTTFPNNVADGGDDSQGWNSVNDTGAAVKALISGGAILGAVVAPAGATVYGWAWSATVSPDPPPSTSACAGGGTVASGTNPAAGTSLATATAIHKWLEFTVGATTYRFSDVAINWTAHKQPKVLSWGRTARGLTDGRGGIESAAMTIRISDVDRVLRGLHSTSVMLNKVVTVYAADEATIRAAGTPWTVFTGVIRDFRPESDLTYRLVLEDALTFALSAFAQERLVPSYVVSNQISDRTPVDKVLDTPVQLCYGSLSDEDEDEPIGTVLATYVQGITVTGAEALGNLYHFLVCLGACHDVQAVFLADPFSGDPPTTRAKAGASEYGTRIFVPHQAGWFGAGQYYETDEPRRFTSVFVQEEHPGADLARNGKIPMLVNPCGRETVGDATGNTIDSLPLQFLHFLNNEVAQSATGNWLAIKALGAYSLFDTASFAAVKTASEARIAGGYKGAFVLGHSFKQITLRDAIAQFCQSGDFDLGINRFGQVMLTMLDRTSTASAATLFTDALHILKDSFSIDPKADEVENKIRYAYKRNYVPALQQINPDTGTRLPREPFDGPWLSGLQSVEDATSISDIGETRESQLLELEMVRQALTADDVAAQRLAMRKNASGRAVATFDVTVSAGAGVELGDIVKVTHFQGLGASGWTARRVQVRRIEVDLDRLTITFTCRDVHDLLA